MKYTIMSNQHETMFSSKPSVLLDSELLSGFKPNEPHVPLHTYEQTAMPYYGLPSPRKSYEISHNPLKMDAVPPLEYYNGPSDFPSPTGALYSVPRIALGNCRNDFAGPTVTTLPTITMNTVPQSPPSPIAIQQNKQSLVLKDTVSVISPLQCGSIKPVLVDPSMAARLEQPFVPPAEIIIRVRVPLAETQSPKQPTSGTREAPARKNHAVPDWLRDVSTPVLPPSSIPSSVERQRSDPATPCRSSSRSPNTSPQRIPPGHVRRESCPVRLIPESPNRSEQRQPPETTSPFVSKKADLQDGEQYHRHEISDTASVASRVGQSSVHTVPTESSCSSSSEDAYYQHTRVNRTFALVSPDATTKRRSVVRSELSHMWGKVSSPLKKQGNKPDILDLKRASGCLT